MLASRADCALTESRSATATLRKGGSWPSTLTERKAARSRDVSRNAKRFLDADRSSRGAGLATRLRLVEPATRVSRSGECSTVRESAQYDDASVELNGDPPFVAIRPRALAAIAPGVPAAVEIVRPVLPARRQRITSASVRSATVGRPRTESWHLRLVVRAVATVAHGRITVNHAHDGSHVALRVGLARGAGPVGAFVAALKCRVRALGGEAVVIRIRLWTRARSSLRLRCRARSGGVGRGSPAVEMGSIDISAARPGLLVRRARRGVARE
jgi:hypothetical protein